MSHPDLHFSFPVNTNKTVKSKPTSDDFITEWRELNIEQAYFNLTDWHRKIDIDQKQSLINVTESQSIIKKLTLKSYESEYKILILWGAENMNVQASNKLLKQIEEPVGKTVIILVAEDEEQLLKTITSRTQMVRVPPVDKKSLVNYLQEKEGVSPQIASQVAAFAEGSLITAKNKLHESEEQQQFFELKCWHN